MTLIIREEYSNATFMTEISAAELPRCFGVVTAYNPNGKPSIEATNEVANARLREVLSKSELKFFRVIGGSDDGKHQEPGFGIVTEDIAYIRSLALQFEQEAFFWIAEGLLYCTLTSGLTMQRLGTWAERQRNWEPAPTRPESATNLGASSLLTNLLDQLRAIKTHSEAHVRLERLINDYRKIHQS
jgi:hypothetical protein